MGEEPVAELRVRVSPRAARDEVTGERDGAVVVRVKAPPVDNRANEALCRLIAQRTGLAPSRVEVVRGHAARTKLVRVRGVDLARVREALGLPPGP